MIKQWVTASVCIISSSLLLKRHFPTILFSFSTARRNKCNKFSNNKLLPLKRKFLVCLNCLSKVLINHTLPPREY